MATRAYTESLSGQELREELIEISKPPVLIQITASITCSPHRSDTPPLSLRFWSRFGCPDERGIFYDSRSIDTTFVESACYRLVFRNSIQLTEPDDAIKSQHTLFSVDYGADNGVKLQNSPFDQFRS